MGMTKFTVLLLLLVAAPAGAAGSSTVAIKDFVRDPIGVYDTSGVLLRKVPKKALLATNPKGVAEEGKDGRILVNDETGKQQVWLRSSDVITTGGRPKCQQVAQVQRSASERVAASNLGVESGMSAATTSCVPIP
ncbi:MAG: hypothetical protein ACOYLS_04680 [Polymorphobacter sp.]